MSECPYCYCDTTREYHTVNCRTNDHLKKAAAEVYAQPKCPDSPEMIDVRLYVFDCQNFVSEKDYRAKQAQVERLILERDAALAGKSLTAISETPDGELIDSPKAEGEETNGK